MIELRNPSLVNFKFRFGLDWNDVFLFLFLPYKDKIEDGYTILVLLLTFKIRSVNLHSVYSINGLYRVLGISYVPGNN